MPEPSLIFTPPDSIIESSNDGLLTASEISGLSLDANVVILAACNTARGGDAQGAEAFAGLAKAFFMAGARSILASYWEINARQSTHSCA